jgi:prepilin-type N-terminal cleavage/methylation domain-containing protein
MKLIRTNQKGFTIIEIVITLAISGLVISAVSGTINQVIQSSRTTDHMNALRQVQTAGYWVSRDGLQAQQVTTSPPTGLPLILTWTDWDDDIHEVVYSLPNMPSGSLKQLQREESLNSAPTATTIVSRYIDPAQTSCVWGPDTNTFTFVVTATMNQETETRTYEVQPRPSS